ncbi:hypothetical protein OSTOST_14888 [Ostertagia ostertagi]
MMLISFSVRTHLLIRSKRRSEDPEQKCGWNQPHLDTRATMNLSRLSASESDGSVPIPEVKVSACSEKSVSASPPGNTTTSTTGVDEELQPSIQIQLNDEVLPNTSKQKMDMTRMDSLTTSEKSEANSLVSSEMDKVSLVKMRFNCNLHRAREDAKKEVSRWNNLKKSIWRTLIGSGDTCTKNPSQVRSPIRRSATRNRRITETTRRRGRTPAPSIERVVLYYTTDRRISLTPSASSLSPSPEPNSQRSFTVDSGRHLFIQSNKPPVTAQDSTSSEPLGDIVVPVVQANSQQSPVSKQEEISTSSKPVPPTTYWKAPVSQQDSMSSEPIGDIVVPITNRPPSGSERSKTKEPRTLGSKIVIYESEEAAPSREEATVDEVKEQVEIPASSSQVEGEVNNSVDGNVFFLLDELSGSEPDEGRVDVSHVYEYQRSPGLL